MISRRQALISGGALALASKLGPRKARAQLAYETVDVVVIGAGLSGLNAALFLEEEGYSVTVLEASDRIGGRVHSIPYGDDFVDVGASEFSPSHARVLDVCDRLNVELIEEPPPSLAFCFHVRDQLVSETEWPGSSANLTQGEERDVVPSRLESYLIQKALPFEAVDDWLSPEFADLDVSVGEVLAGQGFSPEAIRLANVSVTFTDIWEASALAAFRDAARWRLAGVTDAKDQDQYSMPMQKKAKGGNAMVAKAIANAINGDVLTDKVVLRIEQDDDHVDVRCFDNSRYRANFAVVAAPLLALQKIDFQPALSGPQALAVRDTMYGGTTQIHFNVKAPYWDDGYSPSMYTDSIVERVFAAERGGSIDRVTVWINGKASAQLDQLEPAVADQLILDRLAEIRPSTKGKLEPAFRYSWGRHPFIAGHRHSFGAGQVNQFAKELAQPFGRLHIAGEHTRNIEFGTEAAMESGERAAFEIIERA